MIKSRQIFCIHNWHILESQSVTTIAKSLLNEYQKENNFNLDKYEHLYFLSDLKFNLALREGVVPKTYYHKVCLKCKLSHNDIHKGYKQVKRYIEDYLNRQKAINQIVSEFSNLKDA